MEVMRLMAKQRHQMNTHQLARLSFQMPRLAPSEKDTQVESSCPTRRQKPMMGLEAKPEDQLMVMVPVRQVNVTAVITLLVLQPKACKQFKHSSGFDSLSSVLLCQLSSVSVSVLFSLENI